MGERKVLKKYYPPDYDPENVPKLKVSWDQVKTRIMIPFTMQCSDCHGFIYRGTKFNASKRHANEKYVGISLWKFFFKCPQCHNQICFKTDPQNSDYLLVSGGTRNFEHRKQEELRQQLAQAAQAEAEAADSMAQVETRTRESKREMEAYDALADLREAAAANAALSVDQVLAIRRQQREAAREAAVSTARQEEEDELAGIRAARQRHQRLLQAAEEEAGESSMFARLQALEAGEERSRDKRRKKKKKKDKKKKEKKKDKKKKQKKKDKKDEEGKEDEGVVGDGGTGQGDGDGSDSEESEGASAHQVQTGQDQGGGGGGGGGGGSDSAGGDVGAQAAVAPSHIADNGRRGVLKRPRDDRHDPSESAGGAEKKRRVA